MANATPLPEQLIYLIIRFTASVPDLPLSIYAPRVTTTLSLKQLIRQNLPPQHAPARLRLIYAGKVLADTEPLSRSLRLPPPPPRLNGPYNENESGSNSRGKQPLRQSPAAGYGTTADTPSDAKKCYIHCSLGDALSHSELASEATLAESTEESLKAQYETSSTSPSLRRESTSTASRSNDAQRRSSTAPQPQAQGFDRLLSSGFTAQEVASLRSHFQTNLSFTHTPDTMPSPAEMRVLEDRWLDSTATDPSPALTGEGGDAGWGAGFAVEEGGLDDMLWGYMTGFFWPLGALVWGFREEGVWSRRRQLAVVMGVLINTIFGFMRWSA
ncbi:DUF2407 C-terminal domain-containing protein [Ampelomyces quisqualis]|uniref:DUF2407 C-terminal domain-containing protein n=1 Tax=Ampelomyces quisqualis TaxID=50730 RepID=A0A6A5QQX1_AMPQU|nr:DUF2407 C-terminal domain-containing protein [Ampelomyces quisqualis]